MSRIVHADGSPTTQRNRMRRAIAEILRRLMEKKKVDEETKDMLAFIVVALRSMEESIEASCVAWEKRDYFLKADRFRRDWMWLKPSADRIEDMLLTNNWSLLPTELSGLAARFSDVKITKLTKSPDLWQGAFDKLKAGANGRK